ncbi:UDP-N-acetylmuramate--L-alanine ligase [Streptomyces sp. NPDC002742]|uniref:UDP-N-acetylmuramate--L-alanine ligase n=1 Tax=Streptomyces sp. NPDC002742 TaxID=3364663 RepID=UPI00367EE968
MAETAVPKITPSVSAGDPVDLRRAHWVGIGGTGMLPVAQVCAERGFTVSGSDVRSSEGLEELTRLGVRVHAGHAAGHVPADATAVVFTHAVGEENPEIGEAQRRGIPVVHRSAVLNALMADRTAVGVLGTHGKSSTAGMAAFALRRMGQSPSHVVGADLDGPASGGHAGEGPLFVAEVDESDRTHIGVSLQVAVITNITHDHPENYASELDHVDAYEECVRLGMRPGGTLVISADSPGCRELVSRLVMAGDGPRLVTFGLSSSADWRLTDLASAGGRSTAVLHGPGGLEFDMALRVPGVHQLLNAAATIAALHTLGQDCDLAVEQLRYFDGVRRRMTPAGEVAGVRVFDSYAHHPDEVRADLAAACTLLDDPGQRVITVFQPSDQSRLDAFGAEFGTALAGCDQVVLTGNARVHEGALRVLAGFIERVGGVARFVETKRADAVVCAASEARPGDLVVLMGSGDLVESGRVLRAALAEMVAATV